ncbi:hypothetical protein GCM10007414_10000 [Agarivorans gilvus]|uniref:Acyltransferase n=2 Tax=Agarivorans gilvus TaxID=680279 RepID=A0ABQ1I056_9ALTE|nr:hypothetical protein GCM10007414_10000 [Agarivorans gilvus]
MCLGGLAFLYKPELSVKTRKALFFVGFFGLILSVLLVSEAAQWPSNITIIPAFATFVILLANYNFTPASNKVLSILGLSSYSIYLWHWPIYVLMFRYYGELSIQQTLNGIFASIVLGWVSYNFVENNFRTLRFRFINIAGLALVCALGVGFAALAFIKNGFPAYSHFSKAVVLADSEALNREPRKAECLVDNLAASPHCIYGDPEGELALIVFGDSHASAMVTAVAQSLPDTSHLVFVAKAGCPSISQGDLGRKNSQACLDFVNRELSRIQRDYPKVPIMVINRWSYYLYGEAGERKLNLTKQQFLAKEKLLANGLHSTWCGLVNERRVIFVTPTPEFDGNVPKAVAKSLAFGSVMPSVSLEDYQNRNRVVIDSINALHEQCGVDVLYTKDYLCGEEYCDAQLSSRPLYFDDNHLSEFGNRALTSAFEGLFIRHR